MSAAIGRHALPDSIEGDLFRVFNEMVWIPSPSISFRLHRSDFECIVIFPSGVSVIGL
jgi:hypothetical protein